MSVLCQKNYKCGNLWYILISPTHSKKFCYNSNYNKGKNESKGSNFTKEYDNLLITVRVRIGDFVKVLMVDKNAIEMKRIANIMKRNMKEIEITGYVSDKRNALANLEKHNPDVVIISKELEYESGFSIVEEIRKYNAILPVILYALEESMNDLKRSIELKLSDFILAPVTKRNLIPSLLIVYEQVQKAKKELEMHKNSEVVLKKGKEALEFGFIYSVLFSGDKWNSWKELQNIFQIRNKGYVMNINIMPCERTDYVPYDLYSKPINKNAPYGYRCIMGAIMEKQIVMFVMETKENSLDEKSRKMQQLKFAETIRKFFLSVFQIRIAIGIGSERSIDKIPISYEEALRSMRIERNSVISHVEDIALGKYMKSQYYMELESRMLQDVGNKDMNAIEGFTTILGIMDDYKPEDKKSKIIELLVLSTYESRKGGPSTLDSIDYMQLVKALDKMETKELNAWAIRQLTYIIHCIRENNEEQSFGINRNVLKYIETHFDEELSLQEIASLANVSPQYFSRLFREKMGMTYVDYLTKVRINKAVEWLKYSDKTIQEICYDVGYKDPNYFSRVFKKITGLSPKEYIDKRVH